MSTWYSSISFGNSKMPTSPQGLEEFQRHQSSREQVIRESNNAQDMSRTSQYVNASRNGPVSSYTFSHDGRLGTPTLVARQYLFRPATPVRAVEPATANTGVYRNYVSQFTPVESTVVPRRTESVTRLFPPSPQSADAYADAVGMDAANRKVLKILNAEGPAAAMKAMTTRDDGTPMSYAESRARYG